MRYFWRGTQTVICEQDGNAIKWHQAYHDASAKAASGVGIVDETGHDITFQDMMDSTGEKARKADAQAIGAAILIVESEGSDAAKGVGSAVKPGVRAGKRIR